MIIEISSNVTISESVPSVFKSSYPRCFRRLRGARGHELDGAAVHLPVLAFKLELVRSISILLYILQTNGRLSKSDEFSIHRSVG